jgi:hypothetical protein
MSSSSRLKTSSAVHPGHVHSDPGMFIQETLEGHANVALLGVVGEKSFEISIPV